MDRRTALIRFAQLTGAVAFASVSGIAEASSNPPRLISPAQNLGLTIEDNIRVFEDKKGMDRLTVPEARDHILRTTELMGKHLPDFAAPDEVLARTIIIQPDTIAGITREERETKFKNNPLEDPFITQLLSDPNANITPEEVAIFHRNTLTNRVYGWVLGGRIYLDLDILNSRENTRQERLSRGATGPLVFRGNEARAICEPASPSVFFRSTTSHEATHYDGGKKGRKRIHPHLLEYFQTEFAPSPEESYSGSQANFKVDLLYKPTPDSKGEWSSYRMWNEFSTDFISAMVNRVIGTFAPGYVVPVDIANIEHLNNASELTLVDFYRLYRESLLEEFYKAIARAAQKSIDNPAKLFDGSTPEVQLVRFGMDRLPPGRQDDVIAQSDYIFPAKKLRPYFPGIDDTNYFYVRPGDFPQFAASPRLGCVS